MQDYYSTKSLKLAKRTYATLPNLLCANFGIQQDVVEYYEDKAQHFEDCAIAHANAGNWERAAGAWRRADKATMLAQYVGGLSWVKFIEWYNNLEV